MTVLYVSLIITLLCAVFFLLSICIKAYNAKSLKKLVAWSVTEDNHIRCNLPLSSYIVKAQNKLSIPCEYRISGKTETWYMEEILAMYQKDLSQAYFKDQLVVIKSKYVITGEFYFMYLLYVFLSDHQYDYEFLGHDMHKEQLEYTHHGDWGGPLFNATYSLTDFALVFHKMHYITYMYCLSNEVLKDFVPEWNEENLKEILDTKQIQISRI